MPAPTVSVTFDNLGEASELERGTWPEGAPLGEHFSVREALPQLLGMLAAEDIRATFFVEGLNGELYPEALAGLAAAGHEVACHGWRHEEWAELDAGRERELLARAHTALGAPTGFRPPGGDLTASSAGLLSELGFTYCSPAGQEAGVRDGIAILPFAWTLVDAYHYLPRFAERRGSAEPRSPGEFAADLDRALAAGRHSSVVFHAFLAEPEDRFAVVRRHLEAVRAMVDRGALWCVPYREVAARTLS